jgi:hypothetical protein
MRVSKRAKKYLMLKYEFPAPLACGRAAVTISAAHGKCGDSNTTPDVCRVSVSASSRAYTYHSPQYAGNSSVPRAVVDGETLAATGVEWLSDR